MYISKYLAQYSSRNTSRGISKQPSVRMVEKVDRLQSIPGDSEYNGEVAMLVP